MLEEIGEEDFKFECKFVKLKLLWVCSFVEERKYSSKAEDLKRNFFA